MLNRGTAATTSHLRLRGLAVLLRWLPVASWVGGGLALGAAAAVPLSGPRAFPWGRLILAALGGVLLQGFAAHSFNDWEDWRSGTDRLSPGHLSGGSRVIPRGLASPDDLPVTGALAVGAAFVLAVVLSRGTGGVPFLLLTLAAWSAWSYSLPPFRLAYRPLAGEWLAAFPAIAAVAPGVQGLLVTRTTLPGWLAGLSHALFCLGWLMQHHLADISADLASSPPKRTTPAWLTERFGAAWAVVPAAAYFGGGVLVAAGSAPRLGPAALLSGAFALTASLVAAGTSLDDEADIARRELLLIALTAANTATLAACLLTLRPV